MGDRRPPLIVLLLPAAVLGGALLGSWRRQGDSHGISHGEPRADPEGALSRAAEAAERALRTDLDRPSRRRALLLLASARSALGDHLGETEALADAAHREPDQARLWMLLAGSYRQAARFARAEAAWRRADARYARRSTKP